MDLRLLGPVRAWRDETELLLGSARRGAVLAVLALHAGHAVSRQQLVTALWGDEPPASATGNVYTYVSTLRQVLEPGRDRWSAGQLLTSGGGTYCLHVRKQDVDVFRFESLREESRRHRSAGEPRCRGRQELAARRTVPCRSAGSGLESAGSAAGRTLTREIRGHVGLP